MRRPACNDPVGTRDSPHLGGDLIDLIALVVATKDVSREKINRMTLESWHDTDHKRRWKIVRTVSYADVTGFIVSADDATAECCVQVGGETNCLGNAGQRLASALTECSTAIL